MLKKIIAMLMILNLYAFGAEKVAVGLNINDTDLEVDAKASLSVLTNSFGYDNYYFTINWMNDKESFVSPGFYVENLLRGSSNFIFGFGIKSVFTKHENLKFSATPFMISAKVRLIPRNFPPAYISANWIYAPSQLVFQDAKKYLEYRIEFNARVIENIELYAGHRSLNTEYKAEDKDILYNRSLYAGFRFLF